MPLIDSSGARGFHTLAARARRRGGQLYLVGLAEPLRRQLETQGLRAPEVQFLPDVAAVDAAAGRAAAESTLIGRSGRHSQVFGPLPPRSPTLTPA